MEVNAEVIKQIFLDHNVSLTYSAFYEEIIKKIDYFFFGLLNYSWERELALMIVFVMIKNLIRNKENILAEVQRLKQKRFSEFKWFNWDFLDDIWDKLDNSRLIEEINEIIEDAFFTGRFKESFAQIDQCLERIIEIFEENKFIRKL